MKATNILKQIISDYQTKYILNRKEQIKEAIKELEALENRSCSNCKYIKKYNEKAWECKKEVKTLYHTNYIEHDFCCNKWENKL